MFRHQRSGTKPMLDTKVVKFGLRLTLGLFSDLYGNLWRKYCFEGGWSSAFFSYLPYTYIISCHRLQNPGTDGLALWETYGPRACSPTSAVLCGPEHSLDFSISIDFDLVTTFNRQVKDSFHERHSPYSFSVLILH